MFVQGRVTKSITMKWLKTLFFILMVPIFLGSSTNNKPLLRGDDSRIVKKKINIEILASVPLGIPVNLADMKKDLKNLSGFGFRIHPVERRMKFHKGIDFPLPHGSDIFSTCFGTVTKVERKMGGYGLNITVQAGDYTVRYAHCSKILVKKGDHVKQGQVIAKVGSSGLSTGPHLHYEIHRKGKGAVDPLDFLR
jgi:murein DD-endopeptidase MepM/ murein hydrolase activator NlpD